MNERLRAHHEHHEKLDLTEHAREKLKQAQAAAEREHEPGHKQIESLRHQVHEQAVSGREYTVGEKQETTASHTFGAHKALKRQSYRRTLSHIQSRLKGPEKSFSKVIHGRKVEQVSDLGAKTIARPIGTLTGGLFAFIGSLAVLLLAKRYGFTYNFTVVIILFVAGYIAGTLIESIHRLLKRPRD